MSSRLARAWSACLVLALVLLSSAGAWAALARAYGPCLPAARAGPPVEVDVVARVRRVIDGDTFDAFPVGRVRLADVDAPEQDEPGYEEATQALAYWVSNRVVYLDVDDQGVEDPYHRLVCVVYVRYNETHILNVNKWLLDHGYVRLSDYQNEFDPYTWSLYVEASEEELPEALYGDLLAAYLELQEAYESLQAASNSSSLQVEICSGDIHFPGELVEFYLLTSLNGVPVNATFELLALYRRGQLIANLTASVRPLATGFYRLTYVLPADAAPGTYVLLALASCGEEGARGAGLKAFLVSPTLTAWDARLVSIMNDVALIRTDVGYVKIRLSDLAATLYDVQDDILVLRTSVGFIEACLSDVIKALYEIRDLLRGLFTGKAEVAGHQVRFIATSRIRAGPRVLDHAIWLKLAPPTGRRGLLMAILPAALLEDLGATVEDVVFILDEQPFRPAYVELNATYVIAIAYGPGRHEAILCLTGALDEDGDGLANWEELLAGTDPRKPDTDSDLWPDAADPWPREPLVPNGLLAPIALLALVLMVKWLRRRQALSL